MDFQTDFRASGGSVDLPEPPKLLRPLFAQFARPTGLLGSLAGRLMAKLEADDRWVVELLELRPDDRVLDIGCGPGVTVALVANRLTTGRVCGVDPSDVMLRQAARRNRDGMRAGRVELRRGTVSGLPYPDGAFTKACAVHSLYFWPSPENGMREIRRVLAPGGVLVLAVRLRQDDAGLLDPSRYGLTEDQISRLLALLGDAGFDDRSVQRRKIGRERLAAIIARRAVD